MQSSEVSHVRPDLVIECPLPLRHLQGWLLWRFEHSNVGGKPRKVPYYAAAGRRHGVQGSDGDRAQLVTFDVALSAAQRRGFDGAGLAMLPEWGICALDFDDAITPTGALHPDVVAVASESYAEYSPSGKGVRAFVLGTELGDRKSAVGAGRPYGLETFTGKGFVTVTGHRLPITDVLGLAHEVGDSPAANAIVKQRFAAEIAFTDDAQRPIGLSIETLQEAVDVLPLDLPYERFDGQPSWLEVGMSIHTETRGGDAGFRVWDDWSSRSPKYTSPEYGRDRWDSFGQRAGRGITGRSLLKWANQFGAHLHATPTATAAEFDVIAEARASEPASPAPAHQPDHAKFQIRSAFAFAQGHPTSWIIKGVLPAAGLGVLFGASGSGKSFQALELAMAVARGVPWRERKVRQGRVVILCAEGATGFKQRLHAYAKYHGIDLLGLPIDIIDGSPNMLEKTDALDLARMIGEAALVVIDTLAAATPGMNENTSEDMGVAIAHAQGLHRAAGGMVLLVHHSGKDTSKGARGWSGLRAAVDAEFEVVREGHARVLRVTKQKDGRDDFDFGFRLQVVPLGTDEDGDQIDSCVVVEDNTALMPRQPLTAMRPELVQHDVQRAVMEEIALQLTTAGKAHVDEVIFAVADRMDAPTGIRRDTRKQRVQRALMQLIEVNSLYTLHNGIIESL